MSEPTRNEWHQGHVDAAMADPECEDCAFRDPAGGPPLDVATLTRAILNVICGWQDEDHCGQDAIAIAREYARLSEGTDR